MIALLFYFRQTSMKGFRFIEPGLFMFNASVVLFAVVLVCHILLLVLYLVSWFALFLVFFLDLHVSIVLEADIRKALPKNSKGVWIGYYMQKTGHHYKTKIIWNRNLTKPTPPMTLPYCYMHINRIR